MKYLFFILILSTIIPSKLDLNTASYEDLSNTLPLTNEQINSLITFRSRIGHFNTIYDLEYISEISITDIHRIRPLVTVSRLEKKYIMLDNYKVERWISEDGGSSPMSSIWLDAILDPPNVNKMNYDDLYSIPNVTPIDVVAVLKQKDRDYIDGEFELKNSPGISYYGYKNIKQFVQYQDSDNSPHFRINTVIATVPITSTPDDADAYYRYNETSIPEKLIKYSISFDKNIKVGGSFHQYMGQPSNISMKKFFIGFSNLAFAGIRLDQLILGNFTAAFGQSVIMNTTDFFNARRTGYGFTKQITGVRADQTNSNQYVMNGVATQFSNSYFRGTFFTSLHPRDAIINKDGSFTSLIVMQPRLPFGINGINDKENSKVYSELTSSLNEFTWGGNIQISPFHGHHIGFTMYESLYDREHSPQIISTIVGGGSDTDSEFNPDDYDDYSGDAFYLNYPHSNSADPEVAAMYTSSSSSSIWSPTQSSIKVGGFDFSCVINNIAIQGEYGEIFSNGDIQFSNSNPSASVLSTYIQFDNLNLLALYRNYDLEYDNPYQRSFSNYQRYKSTILEDVFWLEDPAYSYLYSGNPQPQAEEGFFIASRYQFHRSFTCYINWDAWNRKADNAKYYRTIVTMYWRPIFNFRLKLRQSWQQRGKYDIGHSSPYFGRESRISATLNLSNFNSLELLYVNNYTTFSPRPRLTDNALGGTTITIGGLGKPGQSMGMALTNNINDKVSIKIGSMYINGFLWYVEDSDFRLFNSEDGSIHNWISIILRPINNIQINFKTSYTKDFSSTKIVGAQVESGYWINNPLVFKNNINFRLQINYAI